MLLEGLERDLPILCEKPLTPDAPSSWEILEAEQRLGTKRIQVGFMRCFDAEYQRLRGIITSGELRLPSKKVSLTLARTAGLTFGAQDVGGGDYPGFRRAVQRRLRHRDTTLGPPPNGAKSTDPPPGMAMPPRRVVRQAWLRKRAARRSTFP
jgi:hypothetical protein